MMQQLFWIPALLFCFLVPGCNLLGPDDIAVGFRKDLLARMNIVRAADRQCGNTALAKAPELKWSDLLAEAALRHAKDVSSSGKEGHAGSDGTGPQDRVRDTGYQIGSVGEILSTGSTSREKVMEGFLSSEGHCRVMMNGSYNEMGAAIAGSRVWVIVFATPAS